MQDELRGYEVRDATAVGASRLLVVGGGGALFCHNKVVIMS